MSAQSEQNLDEALEALSNATLCDQSALDLLFDPGQSIWSGPIEGKPGRFVVLNPVPKHLKHARNGAGVDSSVITCFQTLMCELDNLGIPPEKQLEMILATYLPFTLVIWSGGKGPHIAIRLTEPISEQMWRDREWHLVNALKAIGADINARSPSQRLRMPGYKGPERDQRVLAVGKRVTLAELDAWLAQFPCPKKTRGKNGEALEPDTVVFADIFGSKTLDEWRDFMSTKGLDKVPGCHSPFRKDNRQSCFLTWTESGNLCLIDSALGVTHHEPGSGLGPFRPRELAPKGDISKSKKAIGNRSFRKVVTVHTPFLHRLEPDRGHGIELSRIISKAEINRTPEEQAEIEKDFGAVEKQYPRFDPLKGGTCPYDPKERDEALQKVYDKYRDKVIYVRSGVGTSKTMGIIPYCKKDKSKSIIAVVHRRSLGRDLARRINATYYEDVTDWSNPPQRLVVQIDSLPKLMLGGGMIVSNAGSPGEVGRLTPRIWDYVILDECEQGFRHLYGGTLKSRNACGQVWQYLSALVGRHCGQFIVADAQLSHYSVDMVRLLRGSFGTENEGRDEILIQNTWTQGESLPDGKDSRTSRGIVQYEGREDLYASLMKECQEHWGPPPVLGLGPKGNWQPVDPNRPAKGEGWSWGETFDRNRKSWIPTRMTVEADRHGLIPFVFRPYVCSLSEKEITAIHRRLSQNYPTKNFLLVTQRTRGIPEVEVALKDPNDPTTGFRVYDAVFASPSILSGVDYSVGLREGCTTVYFFGTCGRGQTVWDAVQMVGRPRDLLSRKIHAWLPNRFVKSGTLDQLRSDWATVRRASEVTVMRVVGKPSTTGAVAYADPVDGRHFEGFLRTEQYIQAFGSQMQDQWVNYWRTEKCPVVWAEALDAISRREQKKAMSASREEVKVAQAETQASSPVVPVEEALEIKARDATPVEQASADKALLADFYGLDPADVDVSVVLGDREGRTRSEARDFGRTALWASGTDGKMKVAEGDVERRDLGSVDQRYYALRAALIFKVLAAAGLDQVFQNGGAGNGTPLSPGGSNGTPLSGELGSGNGTTLALSSLKQIRCSKRPKTPGNSDIHLKVDATFTAAVRPIAVAIHRVLGVNASLYLDGTKNRQANPRGLVTAILGRLGISVASRQVRNGALRGMREYWIPRAAIETMEHLSAEFVKRLKTGKSEDERIRTNGVVLALDPNEPDLGELGQMEGESGPEAIESIPSMFSKARPMTRDEIDHYLDVAS